MGACGANSRSQLETLIYDIWSDSDLTKITPESYFNFFKRYVEATHNIMSMDEQDENIYSTIVSAPNYKEFFLNLKCDICFLGTNGKLHLIMLALIFFTNAKDYNILGKYLDKLFSLIKYYFEIQEEIQTDKEFFVEVMDVYILINTQMSLKHVMKSGISMDNAAKEEEKILKDLQRRILQISL